MTMLFADRWDAGRRLAERLEHLGDEDLFHGDLVHENLVVVGLPRGGLPVAFEVAKRLRAPLDVIVVRKLGVPFQPELGMGAIGEGGARIINEDVVGVADVGADELAVVEARERAELESRARRFRGDRPPVSLAGRTVVVVDDGIATGSTARAACQVARARGAARVVLAVPVAPAGWAARPGEDADELISLATPASFLAVGEAYADFSQTTDDEVSRCLAGAAAWAPRRAVAHGPPDQVAASRSVGTHTRGEAMSLEGKVAVVTGASRGIGEFVARRFAAGGCAVAVSARTVEEGDHPLPGSLSATVKAITDAGGTAIAIPADLARQEDRARLIDTAERELGPVDVLVNNAAITYFEPVDTFDERHFRLMFEVQVRAPFELVQRVLPGMRARKRGWILNISSAAARHPQIPPSPMAPRAGTAYGMCKAALERFSTGLAAEAYDDGIAVNALSPSGLVVTPGVIHHGLDRNMPKEMQEPVEMMAEASYALCTGDPAILTGKVTYARSILDELGIEVTAS